MVGFLVGLGNFCWFPSLVKKHAIEGKGGAFVLVYTIMTVFIGLPLVFMELCLGQYTGHGPIQVFGRLAPALRTLGWAMVAVTSVTAICYNIVLAWCLFYLVHSFTELDPLKNCKGYQEDNATECMEKFFNETLYTYSKNENGLSWQLSLCLLASWTIVGMAMFRGIKSSGKVAYFTVSIPFLGLLTFFIYSLTLGDQSRKGITEFFSVDFSSKRYSNFVSDRYFSTLPFICNPFCRSSKGGVVERCCNAGFNFRGCCHGISDFSGQIQQNQ